MPLTFPGEPFNGKVFPGFHPGWRYTQIIQITNKTQNKQEFTKTKSK